MSDVADPKSEASQQHPRAVLALVLGIIGLVTCSALSPIAWVVGGKAVREIDAEPGRFSGRGEASTGKILGIVGSALFALSFLFFLVVVLFIGAGGGAFDWVGSLPRWWASTVGDITNGSRTSSLVLGGGAGFILPLVSAGLLVVAAQVEIGARVIVLIVALALSIPNILTTWTVLGGGRASNVGQRIFDIEAPQFINGTLVGLVAAGLIIIFGFLAFAAKGGPRPLATA